MNPAVDAEARIDALLSALTVQEKLACLSAKPTVPRLHLRGPAYVEGLHGLALGGPGRWGSDDPIATTTYPQAVGLACTWDEDCLREVATVEAYETRYYFQSSRFGRGGLLVRAPSADLASDPRWGHSEESYGEDPYLAGCLATAFVRGLQGEHPRYWMTAALLKHFLASSSEEPRETASSDFDARLFHEYYAGPFRMAIRDGGARAMQVACNKYNGIPLATHPVLEEVVVKQWGQDGILACDGRALRLLVCAHKQHRSIELAVAASIDAGISLFFDDFSAEIALAIEKKLILESDIDRALRKNFRVWIRLGLLDPPELVPFSSIGQEPEEPWRKPEHQESVRRVTQKSIVLLKNDPALLPLDLESVKTVAIIGPLADRVLCDWHSGTMPYAVSPVDGLRERLGLDRVILASNNDPSEAICAARAADVAIVCVGNHPTGESPWAKVTRPGYSSEPVDRSSIQLEDEELVKLVMAANPKTIVVLISSCPFAIDWSAQHVPAILHLSHNSQELGRALADVLVGDYNPAGRLVHTWPSSIANLPPVGDLDQRKGRTYQYWKGAPLYPFGYGMSYARFAYSRLLTSSLVITEAAPLTVNCDVTNIGRIAGDEVAQLYTRVIKPATPRPQKLLVGFRRVEIAAGETQTLTFTLRPEQLMIWDEQAERLVLEPGPIELQVGRSSAHIELICTISAQKEASLPAPGAAATKRPSNSTLK